jgi:hypothetical protein
MAKDSCVMIRPLMHPPRKKQNLMSPPHKHTQALSHGHGTMRIFCDCSRAVV